MKILILNLGSSSIKYKLYYKHEAFKNIVYGLIEAIGSDEGKWYQKGLIEFNLKENLTDHQAALDKLLFKLQKIIKKDKISLVGHRVVHGGNLFHKPTEMNDANLNKLKSINFLAPLHNPVNIQGIEITRSLLPEARHIAVFDTAFHHTIPLEASTYAINKKISMEFGIRKYGFHGISHQFIMNKAAHLLKKPVEACQFIILHLGNGASACAIKNGCSIDNSMGMTPLEGLVMGTRSGDLDPYIPLFLAKQLNVASDDISNMLNKESGLKGICGYNDMRQIEAEMKNGKVEAKLAFDIMKYRLVKYIGAYYALLPKLDAIIFTGGIGENSSLVVGDTLKEIEHLGVRLIPSINLSSYTEFIRLTTDKSPIASFSIRTDEELNIAVESYQHYSKL